MQQVISPRSVITWSALHGGEGVIMRAVLHGGGGVRGGECYMDFSKWQPEILHQIEYLVFHNYFVFFFSKFTFPGPISFRYYCIVLLLPSAATVKMGYEENIENARYATNDDTPLWTKDWIILCCCISLTL